MVVVARRWFSGGEIGVARRPGGQGRFTLTAAGGTYDGAAGVRLAASAQFLLEPGARTGPSLYGGLGIALAGAPPGRGAGHPTAGGGPASAPAPAACRGRRPRVAPGGRRAPRRRRP